jgi:DNA-binding beta-propeller fold protein YncE
MRRSRHAWFALFVLIVAVTSLPAIAQVVTATVLAGGAPDYVAVNAVTNTIYVANYCGNDPTCQSPGTVTVIDGATQSTQSVPVGVHPVYVAVNPVTNTIYVLNNCGTDLNCLSSGSVTVINGATLATQNVAVGSQPFVLAVNSVTNTIYVADGCGADPTCASPGTVTVINGVTLTRQTVTVDFSPYGVAVNASTNKAYVANTCGTDSTCGSPGTATVIDGITLGTQRVPLDYSPYDVGVNSTSNTIYIDNFCGTDPNCRGAGTVDAINGRTLSRQTVAVGVAPYDVEINAVTNTIYVPNSCGSNPSCGSTGTVTVINGTTLATSTVNVGAYPVQAAVNVTTNKIYVVNSCGNDVTCSSAGTVTAIDGASNTAFPVAVGDIPQSVALNASTNALYVPNGGDNTASVIGGATTLQLVNVTPCRLVDTRSGGGPIPGGSFQTFNLPQLAQAQGCGDLSSAASFSLNVTLIPSNGPVGYLTIWPASQSQPNISTMNSDGRVKANAAIVSAGVSGGVSVFVANTSDVVLDIDGYFAPASQSTLEFYPLTPCRVADTRNSGEPQGLGPPSLSAGVPRNFPVLDATSCFQQVPPGVTVAAYSLNFTAVPHGPLSYLTVWPYGQDQPNVSTLNASTGAVTANAAIVPAGTNGDISVYARNDTDLAIDVNGYFAAPGQNGLSLYPTVPCRVLDTRPPNGNGPFSQTLSPPVDVLGSPCGVPSQAQAYALNATVVPVGSLGYLSLWADGQPQPTVSTLNASDGAITSNMAFVFAGTQGEIDAFAYGTTNLILDISGFFAP